MIKKHNTRVILALLLTLLFTSVMILNIVFPVAAGFPNQEPELLPTPTLAPVDDDDLGYILEIVGGDDTPQVFPPQMQDGVKFAETTVESVMDPPTENMRFWTVIESDIEIDRVDLAIRFRNESTIAKRALWDDERSAWRAKLETDIYDMTRWAPFEFAWCMRDTADNQVCSDYQPIQYWDPTMEWFRMENDYEILYWYGFGEDDPDQIAKRATYAAAATHQRRVDGFGRDISPKPVISIYPDTEFAPSGMEAGNIWLDVRLGHVMSVLDSLEITPEEEICPYFVDDEWNSDEGRIGIQTDTATTFGISAVFMCDTLRHERTGPGGYGWEYCNSEPFFWQSGQLFWFAYPHGRWVTDERLLKSIELEDIPPLMTLAGRHMRGPLGCGLYVVDAGTSFINWLVANYGGIDTHRQIVEVMTPTEEHPRGMEFEDAIEQVVGKPFAELENEWRAYLGMEPLE